jgi:hypothetical protein
MVESIHSIIRNDLIKNQKDLFNLRHYYTHKWRSSDRLLDVNVGLFRNENQQLTAQVYVADKNMKIREQFFLDDNYNMIDSNLIKKYL